MLIEVLRTIQLIEWLFSSTDGIKWKRKDENAGITISEKGWDSDSICYPYMISHKNKKFMLYCGNNYGETGFGYAVAK